MSEYVGSLKSIRLVGRILCIVQVTINSFAISINLRSTIMNKKIFDWVNRHEGSIITWRREIHAQPELGWKEFKTQQKILDVLASFGIEGKKVSKTGVTFDLGKTGGPIVALRADMDALPMPDEKGVDYSYKFEGIAHSCGHDAHVAMLLGAAGALKQVEAEIPGKIRFIFQPSEETSPSGAEQMVKDGIMNEVVGILGLHVSTDLPVGTIGMKREKAWASATELNIVIHGKGGHGAYPHKTVDSVLVGSMVLQALHTLVSRNIDPLEPAVLTVGKLESGSVRNVIPETAFLYGTLRTFNLEVRDLLLKRIRQVVEGIPLAMGATGDFSHDSGYPPGVNTLEVSLLVEDTVVAIPGVNDVVQLSPGMGAEDFAFFLQEAPGCFYNLGVGNKERGLNGPAHHPLFDLDESALKIGAKTLAINGLELLKRKDLHKK